jgi:ribose 5-phosphate isomerase A
MTQDQLKRAVAQAALNYVLPKLHSSALLGIGTGSTANCFIDLLGAHSRRLRGAVSSSDASAARLEALGVPVFDLNSIDQVVAYFDGA